jgi:hypothetical protein
LPFFVRASDCDSSTCASHTAGMTGVYHHAHLLCWDVDLANFLPVWSWTSQSLPPKKAEITGMSPWAWPNSEIL